jgi:hypothetical protein
VHIHRDPHDRVAFTTHQKQLNIYQYIPPFSAHPPGVFSGLIKGELTRYMRTCTREEDFNMMRLRFRRRLLARGYSNAFINRLFATVRYATRSDHLSRARDNRPAEAQGPVIPLVARYSNRGGLRQLARDVAAVGTFANPQKIRVLMAWKRSANLAQLLCRSALSREQREHLAATAHLPPPEIPHARPHNLPTPL